MCLQVVVSCDAVMRAHRKAEVTELSVSSALFYRENCALWHMTKARMHLGTVHRSTCNPDLSTLQVSPVGQSPARKTQLPATFWPVSDDPQMLGLPDLHCGSKAELRGGDRVGSVISAGPEEHGGASNSGFLSPVNHCGGAGTGEALTDYAGH